MQKELKYFTLRIKEKEGNKITATPSGNMSEGQVIHCLEEFLKTLKPNLNA